MAAVAQRATVRRGWLVVVEQELRDLWLGGRGLVLGLAFSLLMSVIAYLVATNKALNFLEQREAVNLALQVALAVGALLTLLASTFATTNRLSLSIGLFALLALFAPTQLPSGATNGWAGDILLRANPLTAGLHYVGKLVVDHHPWREDVAWLLSPAVAAVAF